MSVLSFGPLCLIKLACLSYICCELTVYKYYVTTKQEKCKHLFKASTLDCVTEQGSMLLIQEHALCLLIYEV